MQAGFLGLTERKEAGRSGQGRVSGKLLGTAQWSSRLHTEFRHPAYCHPPGTRWLCAGLHFTSWFFIKDDLRGVFYSIFGSFLFKSELIKSHPDAWKPVHLSLLTLFKGQPLTQTYPVNQTVTLRLRLT